jgi:hypothetical protein
MTYKINEYPIDQGASMSERSIRKSRQTLDELLRVLIGSWGYSTVLRRLQSLGNLEGQERTRRHRPSAIQYIERIDAPGNRKEILRELASRFEDKKFLPTIGDVRSFFERRNIEHARTFHARNDVMPQLFEILLTLPDENLQQMLTDGNYAGPSRLGPLSDAIKARSVSIRSGGRWDNKTGGSGGGGNDG